MSNPIKYLCGHNKVEAAWEESPTLFEKSPSERAEIEENLCPDCHAKFFANDTFYETACQSAKKWQSEIDEIIREFRDCQEFDSGYHSTDRLIDLSALIGCVLRYRVYLQKLVKVDNRE